MIGFISLVLVVVFFVILNNRIESLRKDFDALRSERMGDSNNEESKISQQQQVSMSQPVSSIQENTVLQSVETNSAEKVVQIQSKEEIGSKITLDPITKFFQWFTIDWPMKTGAFFLILALGWFVTYAFINDWIGSVGRVSLGLIFGTIFLFIGAYISKKIQAQGNTLSVVGAITILTTILAGMEFYDFFSPIFAFVAMFIVVVFLSMISLYQNNKALAIVTLILGAVVPMFVFEDAGEVTIMLYLFILSAGTIWLVRSTNWKALTFISLLIVAFYSIALESIGGFSETWQNILFAFIFTGLFYVANMVTIIRDRVAEKIDLIIAGIIGILFLFWMIIIAPEELEVFVILLGAVVFALSSFAIFKLTKLKHSVFIYTAVSLMLIASATALQFDGSVLTVAYLLEFGILIMVALYLFRDHPNKSSLYMGLLVLFIVPVFMSFENVGELLMAEGGVFTDENIADLVVLAIVLLMSSILAISTWAFSFSEGDKRQEKSIQLTGFFTSIAGLFVIIMIWVILHLAMGQEYFASMISLIIYTIIGMIFYVKGRKMDHVLYKIIGGLFSGLVIGRLLLVEFWQMDMVLKIITFFVIGTLLITTAFIKKD